jgi:hypothetical protein
MFLMVLYPNQFHLPKFDFRLLFPYLQPFQSLPISFENRKHSRVLPLVSTYSFDTQFIEVFCNFTITQTLIVKGLNQIVILLLNVRPKMEISI